MDYQTVDGTATAGTDFTEASGTLTFAPDAARTQTITLTITNDLIGEVAESFTVMLSNPKNGTLTVATQTITINLDATDPASLSVADAAADEGEAVAFTVTLSPAVAEVVTVVATPSVGGANDTAVAEDFSAALGAMTVTFAANATSQTVSVATKEDALDEAATETFTLTLSSPTRAGGATPVPQIVRRTATGTINDIDGPPSLRVSSESAVEGEAVVFTVTLSAASTSEVTVEYKTLVGDDDTTVQADFTATSGTLTFAAGASGEDLTQTVSVVTVDDGIDERTETFTFMLENATNAEITTETVTGTITDSTAPDAVTLSTDSEGASEGEDVVFTVTLSAASDEEVTVNYQTSDGSAVAPGDYTAADGTLTIAAEATSGTITVSTVEDAEDEGNETFTLTLSSPTGGAIMIPPSVTGTIINDDAPAPVVPKGDVALTISPATVREDASATTLTVKVKIPKVNKVRNVNLDLVDDSEFNSRYLITLPTLSVAADAEEASGEITFTPIPTTEDNSDLVITVMADGGGTLFGTATITMIDADKDSGEINFTFDPDSISEDAGPTDVTVTATLDGAVQPKPMTFALVVDESGGTLGDKEARAQRDIDYTTIGTLPSLTIPSKKVSGKAVITIDPKARDRDKDGEIDAVLVGIGASPSTLNEGAITINSSAFKISDTPIAAIKGLTAEPAVIREDAGTTAVTLDVELKAALPEDKEVLFTIKDETGVAIEDSKATPASRDVNYTATVGDLTIAAGETKGSTTVTVTPVDNDARGTDPLGFTLETEVGGETYRAEIQIVDDETPTTNIALAVDPKEVKAKTGANEITVTGTINGQVFDEAVTVVLVLNTSGSAQRDVAFTATLRSLTIPAGEISGSTTIEITAETGEDKTVIIDDLKNDNLKNDDDEVVTVGDATITLKDADPAAEPEDPGALSFGDVDLSATVFTATASMMLEEGDKIELPDATGGADGDRTYSVANLPAGLTFDAETQTISGTPTTVGKSTVVYTVIDSEGASVAQTFTIEVVAAPPPMSAVESVTVSPSAVRENGEAVAMSVTATLVEAAPVDGTVSFTLGAAIENSAVRDVDYTASLRSGIAIEAGATEASTTLTLVPIDNDEEDGHKYLVVKATAAGGSASADIQISDDETASSGISLSADPNMLSENDGETDGTITATLDGKVLDADAEVIISIDPDSEAQRDVDYLMLFNALLTIPAGEISGSVPFRIDPRSDEADEGSETITIVGTIADLTDGSVTIKIEDYEEMMDDDMMMALMFAEGTMIDDIVTTAGADVSVVLPAAEGGEGDISYSVSDLPAGLSFADSTRTISGSPEAEGTTEVTYTATAGDETTTLTFSITVNAALEFDLGSFFGAFSAGKANPADEHSEAQFAIVVGQAIALPPIPVLGGTPPLTYDVVGLPAGLSFDAETRVISGAPTAVTDVLIVTVTVMDAAGASTELAFTVQVLEPPLGAPGNLVVEDYKGADGQGDQGGFVLMTWELSEHHDSIDGYRIFRALPVLGNEMVPWAMVDAVPGVERGVAVVATLDNVATRWGIAAERDGRTTHGDAKAVFVSADQPYELMAETLMASMEAAQAGDAPMFASLLPEALAYAQGVAPRLNLVAGVLTSAITVTDEPVRAIDNIAPLAVPTLSVLDAPNDQGSRIVLTWTLSPSDQILQDVLAGAIGPLGTEPVVGVYGYNIYRRAASEDEFAKIGQVDAGVASFIDETALNGVRYTYQVRPYDLDNETGSDLEQTAMAVRNLVVDSEGRTLFGLFGSDSQIGFDDFFIFADNFGLTAEDAGFDPAFDLAPNAMIDFDDFFVFADNFGRSTAAAGKIVPMFAGLNADARMYLDARTALPSVGEDFVLDVRLADFAAIKGYGLQVQYEADKLEFVQVLTDQPLGGSELATPQVLRNEAGELALVTYGDMVFDGELALSLVFRPTTEIENTVIEIIDNQTYDSEFGFNRLALPAPVQVQTRPEVFALADNYPNPFNPATTIKYALPQAADVELTVYNVVGQPVRTLVAEHQSAGRYVVEWDATNDNGHSLSSGMYFYRLEAGGEFLEVKKMLLLK